MPRRFFNDGQELTYADLNAISSAIEREIYDRVVYEMLQRTQDAFFGDGFLVEYSAATSVTVNAGLGIQYDNTQSSPEANRRPVYNSAIVTKTLTTPDGVNDRIDIVCVKAARDTEISATRKYKDASDDSVTNQSLVVQTDWEADIIVTAGTPALSPVAPSTPSGYIKIAELLVEAGTGMAGSGAVTDTRTLMPVGGESLVNTLGFDRLTAGSAVSVEQLMTEIDAFLFAGKQQYTDYEVIAEVDEPASPASGFLRFFSLDDGTTYFKDSSGVKTPIGSGGGGGGSLRWNPEPSAAPIEYEENLQQVYLFSQGAAQKLITYLKVPQSYIAGRQIKMYIGVYSPSSSNTVLMNATIKLIRKNQDSVASPGSTRTSTNAAITNASANRYREVMIDISDTDGEVDTLDISPGDLLVVELSRDTDTDTADVRFIPNATEVTFI